MSFSDTYRVIALQPSRVDELFSKLLNQFGEEINDGAKIVKTIGAYWDRKRKNSKRAASLVDQTIIPQVLVDGRLAFIALWQSELESKFLSEGIDGVD